MALNINPLIAGGVKIGIFKSSLRPRTFFMTESRRSPIFGFVGLFLSIFRSFFRHPCYRTRFAGISEPLVRKRMAASVSIYIPSSGPQVIKKLINL